MMYLPKSDIHTALSKAGVAVLQGSQKTIVDVPCITFYISNNVSNLNLQNEITLQEVTATVDIWAKDSDKADELLQEAEREMRSIGYRLEFQMDVPDPNDICHITTQFVGIK